MCYKSFVVYAGPVLWQVLNHMKKSKVGIWLKVFLLYMLYAGQVQVINFANTCCLLTKLASQLKIPDVTFSYFFSSEATGNCLYSSISLLLVGNNRLVEDLRIATSLELYLHPKFYCKHPSLVSCFKEHSGKMFHSFKNLLCMAMIF